MELHTIGIDRAVQEGRRTGRGGRHAATPYRHAPLDGHANTHPSAARKSNSHCRNEGGTMSGKKQLSRMRPNLLFKSAACAANL